MVAVRNSGGAPGTSTAKHNLRSRPETVLSFGIGEDRVENCAAAVIDLCAVLDDRLGPEAREAAAVTCGKSARAGQS